MALSLRVKAGMAIFSLEEGPMKAEWVLRTAMSEEELLDALMSMLRYIRQQPAADTRPPLHAVPDLPDVVEIAYDRGYKEGTERDYSSPPPVMSWKPAVAPPPLEESLTAAQLHGFEPIPPDELGD